MDPEKKYRQREKQTCLEATTKAARRAEREALAAQAGKKTATKRSKR